MYRLLLLTLLISGCAQHHSLLQPNANANIVDGEEVLPASVFASEINCTVDESIYTAPQYRADRALGAQQTVSFSQSIFTQGIPLSPGDLVELNIENGDGFSGRYTIQSNGLIDLPYLKPLPAASFTTEQLAEKVQFELVKAQYFLANTITVNIHIVQWAPIEVLVSGAVYQPGQVLINDAQPEQIFDERLAAVGDLTHKRGIIAAIKAAAGIRPDAKLDQVILVRNGWQVEVDMSGMLDGQTVSQVSLIAGDQIIIPTTGCFQAGLMRPSQITPKGIRVFMSNLISPAENNASAAVGRYSSNVPYGSRLLHAAVSANCVGGIQLTNAPRKIVLASINPVTQKFEVIERSIEELMRHAHRSDLNPYLLPNDAVACYDSGVTNIRDVARTMADILSPISLIF